MSRSQGTDEETRLTREVTTRAIRRLDLLEWVFMGAAALVASASGAVVSLLAQSVFGWSFRPTWIVASVLLFVVPGAIALRRMRKDERELRLRLDALEPHAAARVDRASVPDLPATPDSLATPDRAPTPHHPDRHG